jgi:hypothetical protein
MNIENKKQEMMFLGMNEPVDTGKKCEENKFNYTYLNNQVIYGHRANETEFANVTSVLYLGCAFALGF